MQLRENNRIKITLADRLVIAFASGLTAFTTIVIYFVVASVGIAREGEFDFIPVIYEFLKKFGKYPVILAAGAGFIVGPEKMAEIFSFFWGTHPALKMEAPRVVKWIFALTILAGAFVALYFISR
jgi:hypothetical protein